MENLYSVYLNSLGEIPFFLKKYLNLPSLTRLKNIGYFCGMDYASKDIYNFSEYISRYDHSLTVALLTYRFTHDEKATIAALFHDVATPCFSHVIDYMNKDYANQESTEEKQEDIIYGDLELLKLLKSDNIKPEEIIDFKKYSIVDSKRPKLNADRIDGIILTSIGWTKSIDEDMIKDIVSSLEVYQNEDNELELGFNDYDIALKVNELNDLINAECHTDYDNYMMELLANITKMAINQNIITYDGLYYLDEKHALSSFSKKGDADLLRLLSKFYSIKKKDIKSIDLGDVKSRIINPLVNGVRLNNEKKI